MLVDQLTDEMHVPLNNMSEQQNAFLEVTCSCSFSSPEAALLLVSTKNRDLGRYLVSLSYSGYLLFVFVI